MTEANGPLMARCSRRGWPECSKRQRRRPAAGTARDLLLLARVGPPELDGRAAPRARNIGWPRCARAFGETGNVPRDRPEPHRSPPLIHRAGLTELARLPTAVSPAHLRPEFLPLALRQPTPILPHAP